MSKVWLFAGTTEGRLLAEFLAQRHVESLVSVATEYGQTILSGQKTVKVRAGRLKADDMTQIMADEKFAYVIDATHPFAQAVTAEIKSACQRTATPYLRLLRPPSEAVAFDGVKYFADFDEAAAYLQDTQGNIFLTTGSKNLAAFTSIKNYKERLFVRILPMQSSLAACEALGLTGRQMIAMQGPFAEDLNVALLKHIGAKYLVTKDSGAGGGLTAKLRAAQKVGAQALVIARPAEDGLTLSEIKDKLAQEFEERK